MGDSIAEKQVEYQCDPTAPSFVMTDTSTGLQEGVRRNHDGLEAFVGDRSKVLPLPEQPLIIDAGFDNAVKLNWPALVSGNTVSYEYLLARKGRMFQLEFSLSENPLGPETEDSDLVFFKIAPGNALFSLFTKPIYVGYSRQNRDLRYYVGPSNLPLFADKSVVVIEYGPVQDQRLSTKDNPRLGAENPG